MNSQASSATKKQSANEGIRTRCHTFRASPGASDATGTGSKGWVEVANLICRGKWSPAEPRTVIDPLRRTL